MRDECNLGVARPSGGFQTNAQKPLPDCLSYGSPLARLEPPSSEAAHIFRCEMADSYGSNGLYYMRLLRITQWQHYSIGLFCLQARFLFHVGESARGEISKQIAFFRPIPSSLTNERTVETKLVI